jgi:hypothetical protein
MRINARHIGLLIITTGLAGCVSYNPHGYTDYNSYVYKGEPIYPESYDDGSYPSYSQEPTVIKKEVQVPNSYHVGPMHSPVSFKDQDKNWVNGQNPQNYTIELADDTKPSQVANKIYKAPKTERSAQVQYEQQGQARYRGLYGTYSSYEAAQQALSNLPTDLKEGARVKNWGTIQTHIAP